MLDGNGDNTGGRAGQPIRGSAIRLHRCGAFPGPSYVPKKSQTPMTARARIPNEATVVPDDGTPLPPAPPRQVGTPLLLTTVERAPVDPRDERRHYPGLGQNSTGPSAVPRLGSGAADIGGQPPPLATALTATIGPVVAGSGPVR
jgi:hypothetical protein